MTGYMFGWIQKCLELEMIAVKFWLDTEMSGARDDCCKIRLYFLAKSNYSYRYNLLNSGDQWLVKITIPIYL